MVGKATGNISFKDDGNEEEEDEEVVGRDRIALALEYSGDARAILKNNQNKQSVKD